jgi:hypothetical protein
MFLLQLRAAGCIQSLMPRTCECNFADFGTLATAAARVRFEGTAGRGECGWDGRGEVRFEGTALRGECGWDGRGAGEIRWLKL